MYEIQFDFQKKDDKIFCAYIIYLRKIKMNLQVIIHTGKNLEISKEVVERLVEKNISTKLDNYLKKFDTKKDVEGSIEFKSEKNKKWLFNGAIQATLDGKIFRFEREDYTNLDDLINHLFDHFKQELSNM